MTFPIINNEPRIYVRPICERLGVGIGPVLDLMERGVIRQGYKDVTGDYRIYASDEQALVDGLIDFRRNRWGDKLDALIEEMHSESRKKAQTSDALPEKPHEKSARQINSTRRYYKFRMAEDGK